MAKILTIGEIMLRLQPPGVQRFAQATCFDAVFCGGEANVAVCCAQLGDDARYLTKLPQNPIGDACLGELKRWGVDTTFIARGGERMGIYFCEKGASQRASKVIYDRKYSAFSAAKCEDFDINAALADRTWLHVTGITPALSAECRVLTERTLSLAHAKGVKVSFDLNYRAKLWSKAEAQEAISGLMKYVDVLIANEEDISDVFGISAKNTEIKKGELNIAGYQAVCREVEKRFGVKNIAITLRESYSASRNGWGALFYAGGEFFESMRFDMTVVDRVGGGDSFAAGLINSLAGGEKPRFAVDFAVCCSALKHTVEGDFNIVTKDEVLSLMKAGGGSGRVER